MWRARQYQKGVLLLQTVRPRGGCLHELPSSGSQALYCNSESAGQGISRDHAGTMAEHFSHAALGSLELGPPPNSPSLLPAAATPRGCHAPSTGTAAHGFSRRGKQRMERSGRSVHGQSQPQSQAAAPLVGCAAGVGRERGCRFLHSGVAAPGPAPAGSTGVGAAQGRDEGARETWGKHLFPGGQDLSMSAVHPQLVALLEHLPFALLQQPRAVTHAAAHVASAHVAHSQRLQAGGEAAAGQPLLDPQALPGVLRELPSLLLGSPEAEASMAGPGGGWGVLARAAGQEQLVEASSPPLRDGSGGAQAVPGLGEEEVAARLAHAALELSEEAAEEGLAHAVPGLSEEEVEARLAEAQQELAARRARAQFSAAQEERQLALEQLVREEAQGERWDAAVGLMQVGRGAEMSVGRELMRYWSKRLIADLAHARKAALENEKGLEYRAAVLLQGLPTSTLASLTLQKTVEALLLEQGRMLRQDGAQGSRRNSILATHSVGGKSIYSLNIVTVLHLGKALELEVAYKDLKKAVQSSLKQRRALMGEASNGKGAVEAMGAGSDEELRMLTALMAQRAVPWDSQQQAEVGGFLLSALTRTADIPLQYLPPEEAERIREQWARKVGGPRPPKIFVPAFSKDHVFTCRNVKRFGVLCWNPLLADIVPQMIALRAQHLPYKPMLVPPRPWKRVNQGGYLSLPCSVMRTRGGPARQQQELLTRKSFEEMQQVYQALDVLGSTAWRINCDVAHVMKVLWDEGGAAAGLVDRADLPVPEEPPPGASEEELRQHKREVWRTEKVNAERHSLRSDMEIKLQLLDQFGEEECFYYPHNLDFRGRAYPVHAHLHHLGSDHCRGVLQFAEGKPLGKRGLWWLKAHLANKFAVGGVDKLPLKQRVAFTEAHLEHIMASADRPLDPQAWWRQAEDPFQCLAVCFELTRALRSPDPTAFVSHLPVHQDGSCNGLQHYAALGLDVEGARSVNLAAANRPHDVYKAIANLVRERVEKDHQVHSALGGLAAQQRPRGEASKGKGKGKGKGEAGTAQVGAPMTELQYRRLVLGSSVLLGHVDRKLVKQTVMTSVYGVTPMGAKDQIRNRIREKGLKVPKELLAGQDEDRVIAEVSGYAAKIVLDSLSEMFLSARLIMKWLSTCAELVANQGHCVQWTTPLGLPVVQPYTRGDKYRHARTTFAQITLPDVLQTNKSQVDCARQKSAFPPNFVHSLDSTHMMRTALACNREGITFAGVHDSFWTHASSVDDMSKLLRQEFVALYDEPILENLLEEFEKNYPGIEFPELPQRGNFKIRSVLKSTYFFS